jgi:hypothetical protein
LFTFLVSNSACEFLSGQATWMVGFNEQCLDKLLAKKESQDATRVEVVLE